MDSADVLVAGAGTTGLTLACGLLMSGVRVRVIDRAAGPAVTSRALVLQARGAEVLDRLGALGDLRQRAIPIQRITAYARSRRPATIRIGDFSAAARPLVVSQAEIEAVLRDRLAELGGGVEWDTELVDADQDGSGVTARLTGQDDVRVGWLAGCDGAHSRVRKLAGIEFPGAPVAERFLLADAYLDWDTGRDGTLAWLHRDGVLAAFPLPDDTGGGTLWRLLADLAPGPDLDGQAALDECRRLLADRAGRTDVTIRGARWTSTFRIQRRLAEAYRNGRLLLAGDAAHIHSPVGGQGMNVGIGDAENLAWKLAAVINGQAAEPFLDTFQAERRPVAAGVLSTTTNATRVLLGGGRLTRLLRDRVAVPLAGLPPVQRRGAAIASQLGVSYRRGPLGSRQPGRPYWPGTGLRPGDRVPDVTCFRADGRGTRLYAELGGHWALLHADGEGRDCAAVIREHLGDRLTTLTAPDQRRGELLLIRPDAHLAWRGRPAPEKTGTWLRHALRH